MKIGSFEIKQNSPMFIVAELSANHNGSLDRAIETIRAAKRAGANAIKIQTYTPDTITIDCNKNDFIIKNGSIWDGLTFYDLYKEAYTPWNWHATLFDTAAREGLLCFSTPFDNSAVDFLEGLNCPAYKIASFEITDIPLIEYVASKGKPIILSTGIASREDIELALRACRKTKNNQVALLKCTSSYPAPLEDANLIMIKEYARQFGVIPGLSDHTLGFISCVAAVSLGAKIIEKHFKLDSENEGPDSSFSLTEEEFSEMVSMVRKTEKSIGKIDFELTEKQKAGRDFSRSLYIVENIKKGDTINTTNVRSIRPGFGLHPENFNQVIGKTALIDLERGTPLKWEYLSSDTCSKGNR
jgi:pseudaminic acid synthase